MEAGHELSGEPRKAGSFSSVSSDGGRDAFLCVGQGKIDHAGGGGEILAVEDRAWKEADGADEDDGPNDDDPGAEWRGPGGDLRAGAED